MGKTVDEAEQIATKAAEDAFIASFEPQDRLAAERMAKAITAYLEAKHQTEWETT